MIISNGIDMVRIERIRQAADRLGQPFLDRIWTLAEQDDCRVSSVKELAPGTAASLAARFAAKEAVAKALGTGIGPLGISWTDIEIIRHESSHAPAVILNGPAGQRYAAMGGTSISISLAHESEYAVAHCVILHQASL